MSFKGFKVNSMETAMVNLQSLYDKMRKQIDVLNENIEPSKQFMVLSSVFTMCNLTQEALETVPTTLLYESSFLDFIQMAQNFNDCRVKWLSAEQQLECCKEILTKAETERGALEVKLKHARNQVDVEIRRRQKAEADCEKLVCWINWKPMFADYCTY